MISIEKVYEYDPKQTLLSVSVASISMIVITVSNLYDCRKQYQRKI